MADSKSKKRRQRLAKANRRQHFFEQLESRQLLTAGLDPVVVIPRFGATFADTTPDANLDTRLNEYYTTRGIQPSKLSLEPFLGTYDNLVQSLKNVGYQDSGPSQSLWVVKWDWRTPVAPTDANALTAPDGTISNVTGVSISDTNYGSGLDYLGEVLKQVKLVTGASQVDVIAHSTGGAVARSYIQSAAYGASFGTGNLPIIDDLVLVGVPQTGVAGTGTSPKMTSPQTSTRVLWR